MGATARIAESERNGSYYQPIPCGMPKVAIEQVAEEVAGRLSYKAGQSLDSIVLKLGGRISLISVVDTTVSSETVDGSIIVHEKGNFDIFLPDDVGPLRNRFTVAHEIGHYVLHAPFTPQPYRLEAERYGTGKVEWEANWFAAAFLMPSKQFSAAFQDSKRSIAVLAKRFNVSLRASEIRAQSLRLK